MNDLTVNVSKVINAPATKLFDAWLDPATLAKFMLPMPGMACPSVENDPREGGGFTIVMMVGENKIPHTGNYLEIDRPNKLVFTWASPASLDDSTVTLVFTELEGGKTNVELTHVKFADEQSRSNHEGGWGNILAALDGVA
jgi:uncharacterized protein YndB with AHSA1/START domain